MIDGRFAAGIENMRAPVRLATDETAGFHMRPSFSFFLYNQDGRQAIARPFVDASAPPSAAGGERGLSPVAAHAGMAKYHELSSSDAGTNAPSSTSVYDFEYYRFFVRPGWKELFAHAADGTATSGSLDALWPLSGRAGS